MRVDAALTGFDAALAALEHSLGEELPGGALDAAEAIAADVKSEHAFQNRTDDLEDSVHAEGEQFRSLADVEARVVASMPYASFVNDREEYEFLQPERANEPPVSTALDAAMQRAADDAGWKR